MLRLYAGANFGEQFPSWPNGEPAETAALTENPPLRLDL